MFALSPGTSPPPTPYLTILNTYFKPGLLTRLEKRVKRKTVLALEELTRQIEETHSRREGLLEDGWQLLEEKSRVQAENQLFMEHLCRRNAQCRQRQEELWQRRFQECEEMQQRRQELAARYSQGRADLQAQLSRGGKTLSELKQRLQTLKPVYIVKERQDKKMQALEKEKEKIRGETAAKDQEAHLQFLREKALMEEQLEDLHSMELGRVDTRELTGKYQALARAAKQAHFEFCSGLHRENQQLRKELQQLSQEYHKLEATRSHLEKQQQRLKEKQWYLETLSRGRQRLQAEQKRESHDGNRGPKDYYELSPRH
ncbi:coiled-coil domain-containing protein 121-like [Nannospalax galili]|uniref:coiled-coil domain-containing protein 121-like n=1 Tax=Nannospalax galili TaxID=1026970 RepID=UPI0004ED225A|nr:coiled-coil domain-containing protein 121-like [Nannospalax galili]